MLHCSPMICTHTHTGKLTWKPQKLLVCRCFSCSKGVFSGSMLVNVNKIRVHNLSLFSSAISRAPRPIKNWLEIGACPQAAFFFFEDYQLHKGQQASHTRVNNKQMDDVQPLKQIIESNHPRLTQLYHILYLRY